MTEARQEPQFRRWSAMNGSAPSRPRPRLAAEADVLRRRGAAQPPTPLQWTALGIVTTAPVTALILWPAVAGQVLHHLVFLLFLVAALMRLTAALTPRSHVPTPQLPDAALPAYTVIAPLYREAEVVPQLLEALAAIDYPRRRLQVLVVVEADDAFTREALAGLRLPRHVEVVVAPPGQPRTKPRACNIALERATGDLVTIYDAEDRPHPGQLREAAARFAAGSARLACLQAPLRIEPDRRFLPRQFAIEYAIQFETVLPLLARLGLPFPLGGTSNHFRMSTLRAVGGWDAWNVTEDADLGFRLAAEGYDLGVLELPTLEAAPDRLADWLPQRARWVKGYMQTFGVQTRSPPHWRTGVMLAFGLTLGMAILAAMGHGPLLAWSLMSVAAHVWTGEGWLTAADVSLLAIGWLGATAAAAVGVRRAGGELRMQDLLMMPLYWPLLSLAAAHALWQLVRCPHHWDKTRHAARTGQAAA